MPPRWCWERQKRDSKRYLKYLSTKHEDKKVCCITHTNVAAKEIVERVGEINGTISTIHSFLNSFIKKYKRNLHAIIHSLFTVQAFIRQEKEPGMTNEAYKKREHNRFKKIHDEYTKMLMTLTNDSGEKPVGKREYDKDPIQYNSELNSKIEVLNINIKRRISEESFENVSYNETPFDSLRDLTFGHDGLLKMFSLMWKNIQGLVKFLVINSIIF